MELGTGFTELTDPIEQRRRLTTQPLLAAGGDPEAIQLDEDFLQALEYGMPPTGGVGIGIDQLLIAFTSKNIREARSAKPQSLAIKAALSAVGVSFSSASMPYASGNCCSIRGGSVPLAGVYVTWWARSRSRGDTGAREDGRALAGHRRGVSLRVSGRITQL